MLEKTNYYMRGDARSPEELGDRFLLPWCQNDSPFDITLKNRYYHAPLCSDLPLTQTPHYEIGLHRKDSECSAFVSLTDLPDIAHHFGKIYNLKGKYYIYFGEMEWGVVTKGRFDPYPSESEHSAIGPVRIVSYRKCHIRDPHASDIFVRCDNIFILNQLDPKIKEKIF